MARHKTILFVSRKAPYGTGYAAEMLETVLIAAAFDQQVHLAFLDDGVFQLVRDQRPEVLGFKSLAEGLSELEDYDIDPVWVDGQSLAERGLQAKDLVIPAIILDRDALTAAMDGMDLVLSA